MGIQLDQIRQDTMDVFDRAVRSLGQEEYRDVLEELISDLEARLECVKEELKDAEE